MKRLFPGITYARLDADTVSSDKKLVKQALEDFGNNKIKILLGTQMVAKGLGCEAIRVTKKEEVADAVKKALSLNAPVLLECVIDQDDKVFPMVPAGAPIEEAFDAEDLKKENN